LKQSQGPLSFDQPSHLDGVESSHNMAFHSNSFYCDPRLPKVEVNKFDSLDPMDSFIQMEHYFSLYGITNELEKIYYGFIYLDPERWKGCKNARKGYVAWT